MNHSCSSGFEFEAALSIAAGRGEGKLRLDSRWDQRRGRVQLRTWLPRGTPQFYTPSLKLTSDFEKLAAAGMGMEKMFVARTVLSRYLITTGKRGRKLGLSQRSVARDLGRR